MIAVVDYGMGNRRSVQKALEHVGARGARSPATTTQLRARRRRSWSPGVGAFPLAMRNLRELGLDARDPRRRRRAASRCWGSAWACSCCSSAPRSSRPTDGLGLLPGDGHAACRPAGCGSRTSAGTRSASSAPRALTAGLPAGGLPFYHVHSLAARPARPRRRRRHHRVRRAVRHDRRPRARVRGPVPPREVLRRRPDAARELRRRVPRATPPRGRARRPCAHDPAAGDRHPRRQGGAPGPRGLRPADGVRRRPARRGPALGAGRRPGAARGRPRRGAQRRARPTSSTCAGSSPTSSVPVQVGGGLRDAGAVARGASRPAPRGWCSGRRRCATSTSSTR